MRRRSSSSDSSIFDAMEDKDLDEVESLLRVTPSAIRLRNAEGQTPLLAACKAGWVELVQLLLSFGASVKEKDNDPRRMGSAIHDACWGGSVEVIKLVEEKAAP